jgi:TPR repeat protein
MQPFSPPPKEWKGRSIDVIVPIGPDPRLDFDGAIPFSASDTSPNVSDLLTLLESAQTGEETSQYLLGKKYLDGGEVSPNVSEAISWLQKSAEKDHAESEYLLGIIYECISPDMTKAISWFSKAAEHGNNDAKAALRQLQRQ